MRRAVPAILVLCSCQEPSVQPQADPVTPACDNPKTMYIDRDGDKFGDPDLPVETCEVDSEDGLSSLGLDCDDANADVHPGMVDGCDALDNDCDGLVDEDPEFTFYNDLDGDGFGAGIPVVACEAPDDRTAKNDGDCDDSRADVNPSQVELCSDRVDNDCDGARASTLKFTKLDGTVHDYSEDLMSSDVDHPFVVEVDASGRLDVCGTHAMRVTVASASHTVLISGHEEAVMDAAGDGHVVAADDEGGYEAGANLTLENITLSGGHAFHDGALSVDGWSSLTLRDVRLQDSSSDNSNGGFGIRNTGEVLFETVTVARNDSGGSGGAGVFWQIDSVSIEDSTFELNTSIRETGAIRFSDCRLVEVRDSQFTGNEAAWRASAIEALQSHVLLDSVDILENTARECALYVDRRSSIEVRNGTFRENDGGDLCVQSADAIVVGEGPVSFSCGSDGKCVGL